MPEVESSSPGRAEWVAIIRDLASSGAVAPSVLLLAFVRHSIETRRGQKNDQGGIYPLGISLVAEALGKTEAEVERDVVAQNAYRTGAARALAAAKELTARLRANTAHVVTAEFSSPGGADSVMRHARNLAKRKGLELPLPAPSAPWVSVLRELASSRPLAPEVLYVLARIRRVRLANGESAGPLDADESAATVAAALGVEARGLREKLEASLAAAPLEAESNPVLLARALDATVRAMSGVESLEDASRELGLLVLAKRHPDGTIPLPPWDAFPEPLGSARWRMGSGEDYLDMWRPFFGGLGEVERARYLELSPPRGQWKAWVRRTLDDSD